MRAFCSTCGTAIDGSRQYCATCGVYLAWGSWAPPLDARVCPNCRAPNAPARTDCGRCRRSLLTGLSADCGQVHAFEAGRRAGHVPRVRPAAPPRMTTVPAPPGGCSGCGTVNPPDEVFCGTCGRFLDWSRVSTPLRD